MEEFTKERLQLAKTVPMESIIYPCIAELKYDGVRAFIYKSKIYSRRGKEVLIPTVTENLKNCSDSFIDMEVTLKSGKKVDRTKVTGMFNSCMKGGHDKVDQSLFYFNIFDSMKSVEFENKVCDELDERKSCLLDKIVSNHKLNFRQVNTWKIDSFKQLKDLYDEVVSKGYEGLVVKHLEDCYDFGKRSKQWARFKPTKTADLRCVGSTDGTGKYEGMIGALILVGKVEGKDIVVKAGSGLTDIDRAQQVGYFLNKTIEVNYDSVTKDKTTGQYSLFQPRYVMIREDK